MTSGSPVWIPIRTRIGCCSQACSASARLRLRRGEHRLARIGEGEVERVALHLHLDAAVPGERLAQQAAVILERPHVRLLAELLQQPRRALDVREEQRDRAARKLRHDQAYDASRHATRLAFETVASVTRRCVAPTNDSRLARV